MASILLVDDSPDLRIVLKQAIELFGHNVHSARDGQEALTLLDDYTPHLMICDMTMPILDGETLIRRVRANERLNAMIIIAMSGSEQDAEPAQAAGANYFFMKPFNVVELDSLMTRLGLS